MNNEFQFKFGTPESPEDVRDVLHSDLVTAVLPPQTVEIVYDFPHDNQRAIGICTAADLADMLRKIYGIEFSEQFIYVGGKSLIDGDMEEGSSIRTMLQFVYQYGAAPKSMVPTDDTNKSYADYVNVTFAPEVWKAALSYKIPGYARAALDPIGFASALAASQAGLMTRMAVGDNFYRPSWSQADLEPLRAPNPVDGGHSIKVRKTVGLDNQQRRTMRNTWGDKDNPVYPGAPTWGNNGDLDYIYETQAPYVTEAWVILPVHPMTIYLHRFTTVIAYGQTSPEVSALQRIIQKYQDPNQLITGYYGDLTAKNVLAFQVKNNVADMATLNQLAGKTVGPATRAALNKIQGL